MDWLYKIAKIVSRGPRNEVILKCNLDDNKTIWMGQNPDQILKKFIDNKSIFHQIQKKPFVHIVFYGESILQKEFQVLGEVTEKILSLEFPNYKPESVIVSSSHLSPNTGLALFLPLFRYESFVKELQEKSLRVSQISLCNTLQGVEQIEFRNEPLEVITTKKDAQYHSSFKHLITKGTLILIVTFSLFFLAEKLKGIYLNDHLNQNKSEYLQQQKLDEINQLILVQEDIIHENTNANSALKYPFLNEIASTCPNEIHLTHLNLFPTQSKIKPDSPIHFKEHVLTCKGETRKLQTLHDWTTSLEQMLWVKGVSIIEIFNNPESSNLEFKLQITI